jgi:hypothetical protein
MCPEMLLLVRAVFGETYLRTALRKNIGFFILVWRVSEIKIIVSRAYHDNDSLGN